MSIVDKMLKNMKTKLDNLRRTFQSDALEYAVKLRKVRTDVVSKMNEELAEANVLLKEVFQENVVPLSLVVFDEEEDAKFFAFVDSQYSIQEQMHKEICSKRKYDWNVRDMIDDEAQEDKRNIARQLFPDNKEEGEMDDEEEDGEEDKDEDEEDEEDEDDENDDDEGKVASEKDDDDEGHEDIHGNEFTTPPSVIKVNPSTVSPFIEKEATSRRVKPSPSADVHVADAFMLQLRSVAPKLAPKKKLVSNSVMKWREAEKYFSNIVNNLLGLACYIFYFEASNAEMYGWAGGDLNFQEYIRYVLQMKVKAESELDKTLVHGWSLKMKFSAEARAEHCMYLTGFRASASSLSKTASTHWLETWRSDMTKELTDDKDKAAIAAKLLAKCFK